MPRPYLGSSASALFLLGALLATFAPTARAGDEGEDEAESPAARWTKAAAAFPAPSAEKGFDWEIELVVEGTAVGTGRLSAAPATEGEKAVWKTAVALSAPSVIKAEMSEVLTQALDSLRGESQEQQGTDRKSFRWEKTAEGTHKVRLQKGDDAVVDGVVNGQGRLLVSMASGLLALRLLPADAAEYEAFKLDDDGDTAEEFLEKSQISVKGVQKWAFQEKERDAWLVDVKNGDETIRVGLEPATRNLIGVEIVGQPVAFVPKGQGKTAPKVDLSQPAKTAQIAAAKAMIAFATADKELLDAAIHWPSALAAVKEEHKDDPEAEGLDEASLKALVIAGLQPQGERGMIEPLVLALVESLKTEKKEDGHVVATFPDTFGGLALETAEVDGVWYVVRLPKS